MCSAVVMDYSAPRCTPAVTSLGASKRAWATAKLIRTSHCSSLGGKKIENLTIVSSAYKLNKARIKRQQNEGVGLHQQRCTLRRRGQNV